MYCNVMFIWFSHRYSFTLKLQSEWTLLLELVRNLKGQKRKKTHTRQIRVFTFFFWNQNDEHIFYNCGLETWDADITQWEKNNNTCWFAFVVRAQALIQGPKPFCPIPKLPLVPLPSLTHVAWQQSVAVAWQYCAKEVFSFSIVASEASIKQQAAMVWAWFELQRKICFVRIHVQRFCMLCRISFAFYCTETETTTPESILKVVWMTWHSRWNTKNRPVQYDLIPHNSVGLRGQRLQCFALQVWHLVCRFHTHWFV